MAMSGGGDSLPATTVARSFIKWMQTNGYGTFGTNIFLNQIPDKPDTAYWVTTANGDVAITLVTAQNTKQYILDVNYRNISEDVLEQTMFNLETKINTREWFELEGFEVYSVEASMTDDNDRDAENRRTAFVTVTIEIYKTYVS